MKLKFSVLCTVFITLTAFSQVEGPPPEPAGYIPLYSCDEDFDGVSLFDLTSFNPFRNGENALDYLDTTYYMSTIDSNSQINPIDNPQSYLSTGQGQFVYARVNPVDPSENETIHETLRLYAWWFNTSISEINVCAETEIIDLSSLSYSLLCSSNLLNKVGFSFYMSYSDAIGNKNAVNVSASGLIYVRADSKTSNEFQVSSFNLIIKGAPEFKKPSDYLVCDDNDDGIYQFDLSLKTEEISNGNTDVSVSYYSSMFDAESRVNALSNVYTNTTNLELIYARVENNISSCYEVTTFNVHVWEQPCKDIGVYLISVVPPRPGFKYRNQLVITNKGISTISFGSVEFKMSPLVLFNNVSDIDLGNSVTNTSTGFILDFVNLEPNESESVVVNMSIPVNVSLGTLLTNSVSYSEEDLFIENNTSSLTETVIGSYDPNDIAESHGPEIFYDDFSLDDYLYYTIRFQNVGTADAIHVSIDNTLDAQLDKLTVQMLSASHDYVFTRTDNQLHWKFDNIHLPSEDMDAPNSHGFVYYKIKPTAGYNVGDVIPNTAEIYFDFNEAVVTNTFETAFVATLSNTVLNKDVFSVFPNPANNKVGLKFSDKIKGEVQVRLYDIQGKLIMNSEKPLQNKTIQLDVSHLKIGMYFLNVKQGIHEVTKKLLIN